MKKTGSFGSAKPLPGQSGYNVSQTSQLEKEALEMENQLKLLQDRMQQQNESDEKLKSSGSETRWGGASKKKGSVTSYAKDVQERLKKQSNRPKDRVRDRDPSKRATASARRSERQQSSEQSGFNSKNVDQWSVADVSEWLASMLLQQHATKFANNAISGPILLEVSLEDLDYMEVTVLAHRKILLKGIEDLRKNKRVTKQLFAPTATVSQQVSAQVSTDDGGVGRVSPEKEKGVMHQEQSTKQHWSTLEPLRMREVTEEGGAGLVNCADSPSGGGGVLDEEAERKAFQEAVMAWRNGSSVTEESKGGTSLLVSADSGTGGEGAGQWSNPFAGGNDSGSGMDGGDGDMVLVSARSHYDNEGSNGGQSKSSLADGVLDEDKERLEFQKAVEAWRKDPSGAEGANKSKEAAEKLALEMDAMYEQSSKKLSEDQEGVLRKIDQARADLHRAKINAAEISHDADDHENSNEHDIVVGYEHGHHYGGDSLSPSSSLDEQDDEAEHYHAVSYVEVELIESKVGCAGDSAAGGVDVSHGQYSVDEPSSDDEA